MSAMAATHEDRASEFAAAVRVQLADLPADELDELLDGLQADLAERLADGGELGDPGLYADELRQAAGLPPRGTLDPAPQRRPLRQALREWWGETGRKAGAFLGATPARRGVRDFLVSLRPLWWVARGLVLTWVILLLIGHPYYQGLMLSFPALVLALVLVIVSVQWGRGRWVPQRWIVALRRAGSVIAAILLIPAVGVAWSAVTAPRYLEAQAAPYPEGLVLNGE